MNSTLKIDRLEQSGKNLKRVAAITRLTGLTLLLTLGACAVGPQFELPSAPGVDGYIPDPLPAETASVESLHGDAQIFVLDRDIPAQWWQLFESQALNDLIVKALENNPDLQAAEAAIRQSQENLYASRGSLFPSVDGKLGIDRRKYSGASFGQPDAPNTLFTLYNASVDVSYDLDLFGRTDRVLEALMSQLESEQYRREAAYLTLTTNVVIYAVQEASLREQIAATRQIAENEEERLDLLQQDLALGAVAGSSVIAQQAILAEVMATIPPLEKQLALNRNQLAVLAGQTPGEILTETFTLSSLTLPEELPVALPSDLVQQRPDIKISAALLHAASAEVGVATANTLPQISLTGSWGSLTPEASDLFISESIIWNVGAGLTQPLFHGGELRHRKRAAIAGYEQAEAQYRGTVLQAFQDVADSLQALTFDARTLAAQVAAEQAVAENLDLMQQQLDIGAVSYTDMLEVQRRYTQARLNTIQSQAARITDTAALFQSLGGGWWNRE